MFIKDQNKQLLHFSSSDWFWFFSGILFFNISFVIFFFYHLIFFIQLHNCFITVLLLMFFCFFFARLLMFFQRFLWFDFFFLAYSDFPCILTRTLLRCMSVWLSVFTYEYMYALNHVLCVYAYLVINLIIHPHIFLLYISVCVGSCVNIPFVVFLATVRTMHITWQ